MKTLLCFNAIVCRLAFVLAALFGETGAHATTAGALDLTFNTTGFAITPVSPDSDSANALAIQPDGKIVAVGSTMVSGQHEFAVVRYNTDGSLDTTFDGDGVATTNPTFTADRRPALPCKATGRSWWAATRMPQTGTPVVKTFTVLNSGTSNLTGLAITTDGTNAVDFTVGAPGLTTVAPGGSTTFDVTFNPTVGGSKTAAIHVASNDANENPFDINLSGTGTTPVPEIAVEEPAGTGLNDNASTVDFGGTGMTTSIVKTFTIKNTGTANLTSLAVTKDGSSAAEFAIGALGATTVPPAGSTTFTVTFSPLTLGAKTAAIHIASNDADENPFDVALTGTGGPAPITPATVKATSFWSVGDGNHINLINGLGLSGGGSVLTQTHGNSATANGMWHAGPNNGGLGGPTGSPPTVNGQMVEFDLGGAFDLATTHIWNHNQSGATNRGVKDFQIWVSPDTTSAFTQTGTFVLNQAPGTAGLAAQVFTTAAASVRRVQLRVQSIWAGTSTGYTGLSEVRFAGVQSLPEIALHDGANTSAHRSRMDRLPS